MFEGNDDEWTWKADEENDATGGGGVVRIGNENESALEYLCLYVQQKIWMIEICRTWTGELHSCQKLLSCNILLNNKCSILQNNTTENRTKYIHASNNFKPQM